MIRLTTGVRIYLQAIIDNFSRRILAWRVTENLSAATTRELLVEASSNLPAIGDRPQVVLMTDGGSENFGDVDSLLKDSSWLQRVVAQVEVIFSNSLVEAWWRELKHRWLFLHLLDSVDAVRRLVRSPEPSSEDRHQTRATPAGRPTLGSVCQPCASKHSENEWLKTGRDGASGVGPMRRSILRDYSLIERSTGRVHEVRVRSSAARCITPRQPSGNNESSMPGKDGLTGSFHIRLSQFGTSRTPGSAYSGGVLSVPASNRTTGSDPPGIQGRKRARAGTA